jgi:hypothetical protein
LSQLDLSKKKSKVPRKKKQKEPSVRLPTFQGGEEATASAREGDVQERNSEENKGKLHAVPEKKQKKRRVEERVCPMLVTVMELHGFSSSRRSGRNQKKRKRRH